MLQIVLYTVTAIILYVVADWILSKLEQRRGEPFPNRSLIFFVIILVLAVTVFEGLQRFLVTEPAETATKPEAAQKTTAPMPSPEVAAIPAIHKDVGLVLHDPWVRSASPTATVMAAYLRIDNTADLPRILTGVRSANFESVEIHNTVVEDGLARMIHQEQLEVPARGSLTFKPGGYHLMLMGRKAPLNVGDQVELTLVFENGEELPATAAVRKETGATQMKCGSGKCGSGKCGSAKCGAGKCGGGK